MFMILPSSFASSVESGHLLSQMWWLLFTLAANTGKALTYIAGGSHQPHSLFPNELEFLQVEAPYCFGEECEGFL